MRTGRETHLDPGALCETKRTVQNRKSGLIPLRDISFVFLFVSIEFIYFRDYKISSFRISEYGGFDKHI